MSQLESVFQKKVVADLKKLKNGWFFKSQEVARRGIPDIIMCLWGLFIALELKRDEKEKADPLQLHTLNKIEDKAHGIAYVVNPDNWPHIYKQLQEIDIHPSLARRSSVLQC